MDIEKLDDAKKVLLVNSRWNADEDLWTMVKKLYDTNLKIYKNTPDYITSGVAIKGKSKIRANRIFRNMESVINALIANPPQPNFIPTRETDEAKDTAETFQEYCSKRYDDLNTKEQLRKGLRNLYFARLIVLKPFWNPLINDFDVRSVDPRNIRVAAPATKEIDTNYVIEEVSDTIMAVIGRFPEKKEPILELNGYKTEEAAYIENPTIKYKEAWVDDQVLFVYQAILLGSIKNPTWDWDGIQITTEEADQLAEATGEGRRSLMNSIREQQPQRAEVSPEEMGTAIEPMETEDLQPYLFNHFNFPRKPYIFATIFNNENTPIGQTDMITQAAPLQEGIDRRKQDIDENASLVNGQVKVDSSVMEKGDAQKLQFEARGVIWGKGVVAGVTRETGTPLPQFVYEDMVDSRSEIDNIMAASSAFRGEREGEETKAGRLALIDQSYLALNEMVQVVDFVFYELFNWWFQLAKVNYTENHIAKYVGIDNSVKVMSIMQDDFEDGAEVKVITGKTLPEDRQFKYEQAQMDAEKGFISPVDYLEIAGYENPTEKAKNAASYVLNPPIAAGLTPEEIQELAPPAPPEEKPPTLSMSYMDLPPDGQVQMAAKAGIELDPNLLIAMKMHNEQKEKEKDSLEAERTKSEMQSNSMKATTSSP